MVLLILMCYGCLEAAETGGRITQDAIFRGDQALVGGPIEMREMQKNLAEVPRGQPEVQILNLSYNLLVVLPDAIFNNKSYRSLEKILLNQNLISEIAKSAFRDLKKLKHVDLSDNRIANLDPYTFSPNKRLERLVLINNQLSFRRIQVFLNSYSLETLMLSRNNITEVYPITFIGLPSLKRLTISYNPLSVIREDSFRMNVKLQYVSLAHTRVDLLTRGMFHTPPPMVLSLEGTMLSENFEPPLTQVRGEAVQVLLGQQTKNN